MSAKDEPPSGTVEQQLSPAVAADITTVTSPASNEAQQQADETLDWQQVVELQAFSERKTWIEDKISFLEQMPPVEVFMGMDAIRASAEAVPGLPTRQELDQWLVNHDAIEKETEVFDTGELQTIRKFTKAATQRNLSPADTDLIELTLTTIYDLDKLLHLLRDRSENLDLLGLRLSWEDLRSAAWIDRRTIIADLEAFLSSRARWSPSVYEDAASAPPTPPTVSGRRESLASLASVASDTLLSSTAFSRSARFKLAEVLSRDAAQFSARITNLRHNKIAAAGKVLDKLIDTSRKPVPEDILDEQDRLEEKGIVELENVGKFVMNAVMQWRKADEIYVECMKDQVAAQALWDEIESAKLQHPTARQSASFATRADALIKRLILRGDPASPTSAFPRPSHVLFPQYSTANESVVNTLSSEISAALDLARKAESSAKEYCLNYEAVHRVETLVKNALSTSKTFAAIMDQLEKGVSSADGDGTPPNLMSDACLEPVRHAAFLALLPSILKEHDTAAESAAQILRSSRGALLGLDRPDIDPKLKGTASAEFQKLSSLRGQVQWMREDVVGRVGRLKEARRIWCAMEDNLSRLEGIRRDLGEAMEKFRWQQELNVNSALPPTPDSFSAPLPSDILEPESAKELEELHSKLAQEVDVPLSSLSKSLEAPLNERLLRSSTGLKQFLEQLRQMANLLEAVKNQATVMGVVRGEFHDLQGRIDDLKARFDDGVEDVPASRLLDSELGSFTLALDRDLNAAKSDVQAFRDGLSERVPFVSRISQTRVASAFVKRRFSSTDLRLAAFDDSPTVELPFDLQVLDDAVRSDSNAYTMRLGGDLDSLNEHASHFRLAIKAKDVDAALATVVQTLNSGTSKLSGLRQSFSSLQTQTENLQPLFELGKDVTDVTSEYSEMIARSLGPIRDLLKQMEQVPCGNDSMYLARLHAVDDAELQFNRWVESIQTLSAEIIDAQRAEEQRIEAERARIAAEEVRLERVRLEEEEAARVREAKLAEERREQAERDRIAAEEKAAALLAEEQAEEAERQRLELARLEQERQLQAERERIAADEAERARLDHERLEMAAKLKLAQEQLALERKFQAEQIERESRERAAREQAERERMELEKSEQAERERQAAFEKEQVQREHRLQMERDRMEADTTEKARLANEQRLAQERFEIEAKLKSVEQQLATECAQKGQEDEQRRETDRRAKTKGKARAESVDHDIFGLRATPSDAGPAKTAELSVLQTIFTLRKRLRALSIEGLATSVSYLPTDAEFSRTIADYLALSGEVSALPETAHEPSVDLELASLRAEVAKVAPLINHLEVMHTFLRELKACDAALSDLLEHVDTYPSAPLTSASPFQIPDNLSAEEQLSSRIQFTAATIASMKAAFKAVNNDLRAVGELDRVQQTWVELEEMAKDRILGRRSRPPSVSSSGRNSSASLRKSPTKSSTYSNLSVASPTTASSQRARSRLVPPQTSGSRRSTFGNDRSRSPSQLSNVSSASRSTSGPIIPGSTFASRQRTSSPTRTDQHPSAPRRPSGIPLFHRTASPTISDASSYSRSILSPSRSSSASTGTWSRTPRYSLSNLPKHATPQRKPPPPRKKYIANPQSKLDVAVGEVVNKLPVGISIEGVSDSWKDQSGKYWIGDQDPKLCFCRILRSQTVMVRVGGGWQELSKFIQNHFADSFRLFEDSPPRPGAAEPKWISSATLLETAETVETGSHGTPPQTPRTPEPRHVPTFSLITPTGNSPQSLKSASSTHGSPLTPLQFMRRAEPDSVPAPTASPSKSHIRTRTTSTIKTPARNSIWRP
ncbi:Growth arrest-specific 2-like [Mycena kentingensis (nom. inval.)]|nr:Growth arrest-specific 2-like [Mycena kentingensis (nom. inval.)]